MVVKDYVLFDFICQVPLSIQQCNNARAKRVRIVFCDRVWRDQPRGKTKGGAAPRFFPEVDPDTRGRENTISSSKSERIVIAF